MSNPFFRQVSTLLQYVSSFDLDGSLSATFGDKAGAVSSVYLEDTGLVSRELSKQIS